MLKFEDTLSEENHRSFNLIYESLMLEGRAGNLTNLMLEMVLAEKPPTWLHVMYKRLKHLLISSDTFREKKRTAYDPQVGGRGRKIVQEWRGTQKELKFHRKEENPVGKMIDPKQQQRQPETTFSYRYL